MSEQSLPITIPQGVAVGTVFAIAGDQFYTKQTLAGVPASDGQAAAIETWLGDDGNLYTPNINWDGFNDLGPAPASATVDSPINDGLPPATGGSIAGAASMLLVFLLTCFSARAQQITTTFPTTNAVFAVSPGSTTNTANVAWDAVTNWQSTNYGQGYQLFFGAGSGNYTSQIDCQTNTNYTLTSLNCGATYYLALQATNGPIISLLSSEVSIQFIGNQWVCLPPLNLRIPKR